MNPKPKLGALIILFTTTILLICICGAHGECPSVLAVQRACLCSASSSTGKINLVCRGPATASVLESLKKKAEDEQMIIEVQNLIITDSQIPQLFYRAFAPLKVETITIENSQLQQIHPGAFSGLQESLTHLNLANNQLSALPTVAMEGLNELLVLNLDCNSIPDLDEDDILPPLPKLRQINLSCNNICKMSHRVFENVRESVTTILLDKNCLSRIPGKSFNSMPQLSALSLAQNAFTRLYSFDLVDLPNLRMLRLNGNEIRTVDQLSLTSLPKLQHLILSDNEIRQLEPGTFNQLLSLQTLDMSSNDLTTVPTKLFADFASLRTLNLSSNLISELQPDDAFVRVKSDIETLDISNNCVGTVPRQAFRDFVNLKKLSLVNNNIHTLERQAFGPNIREVDISHNFVDDENVLRTFSASYIIFRENPLVCRLGVHYMREGRGIRLVNEKDEVCQRTARNGPACPTREQRQRSHQQCCGKSRDTPKPTSETISPSSSPRSRPSSTPKQNFGTTWRTRSPESFNGNVRLPNADQNGPLTPAQQRLKALIESGAAGPINAANPSSEQPLVPDSPRQWSIQDSREPSQFASRERGSLQPHRNGQELPNDQLSTGENPLAARLGFNPEQPWGQQALLGRELFGGGTNGQQSQIDEQRLRLEQQLRQLHGQNALPGTLPNLRGFGQGLGQPLPGSVEGVGSSIPELDQKILANLQNFIPQINDLRQSQPNIDSLLGLNSGAQPSLLPNSNFNGGNFFPQSQGNFLSGGLNQIDPRLFGSQNPYQNFPRSRSDFLGALGLPTLDDLLYTGTNLLNNLATTPLKQPVKSNATTTEISTTNSRTKQLVAKTVEAGPVDVDSSESSENMEKVKVGSGNGNVFLIRAKELKT